MAGIVDQILLNIQATVTGQGGVQQLSGSIGGLTSKLVGLNAGLQVISQVTQGVQGLLGSMGTYARQADGAAVAARSWQVVLSRFNIDAKTAEASIDSLSARTGASVETLQGAAASFIKAGGSLADYEKSVLAAASSWYDLPVKNIALAEAINNVTLGVVMQRSEMMESAGINVNASDAIERYARANDRTVESLSDSEKAHAYALAVYKEEKIGIETLADKQTDLTRAENEAAKSKVKLGQAIGQLVLPAQIALTRSTTEVVQTVTAMLTAYREGGDVLAEFATRYPQLAAALNLARPALQQAGRFISELGQIGRDIFQNTLLPLFRALAPQVVSMVAAIAPQFARFTAVAREIGETARDAFERVIVPRIRTVAPVVMQMVRTVVPLLAQFAETFSAYFRMVVTAWERIALPVIQAIAPAVQTAVRLAGDVLGALLGVVKGIFNAVRAAISGDWTGAWNIAQTAVGTALGKIQGVLDELLPKVWKVITDLASGALTRAKTIGANLRDGLTAGLAGLAERLATDIGGAIERATARLPDWAKRLLGITAIQGVVAQAASVAGAAADGAQQGLTGRTQASTQQAIAQQAAALPAGSFNLAAFQQAFMSRNDAKADTIVDYCARWVRDTLGDAAPQMRAQIDALFQANPEKYTDQNGKTGYVPTARSAYKNFQAAGLARDYSTTADLKPGDTVFYTEDGQNHTGVYIGAGQVRGNNRVSFQESGGTNPVGNVDIGKLGSVSGYVRLSDLEAYIRRATPAPSQPKATSAVPDAKPPPPPSKLPPPETPEVDPKIAKNRAALQKEIDEAVARGRIEAAQRALEGLKRLQGEELDGATKSAAQRLAILERTGPQILAVEGRIAQRTREQAVQAAGQWAKEELAKVGADAKLIEAERVRRVQEAYAVETEARKGAQSQQNLAVAALERQSAEEGKSRAKEQAAIRAQIAEEGRQLSITKAQQTADRLRTLNGQELSAFKGTAQERLEVVRRQSQDEYLARMKVAQAVREQAEAAARNGPAQLRAGREQAAARDYENTRLEAQGARLEAVRVATDAAKKSQDEYTATLDEGTRAGNEALASLDQRLMGGRDLAQQAQTLIPAEKTFAALLVRFDALRGELSTPGTADAWIAVIEDFGKAGRLTTQQIADLKAEVVRLRDETATLVELGGAIVDPETGELLYKTENQVRGIGEAVHIAADSYFNLGSAIENVGLFSESELTDLIQKSGLAADEAERLYAAWNALYGTINTGPQLPDNLQGRGVSDGAVPGPDDGATGNLASGEAERLRAAMDAMNLDDIGQIYADLILKGFKKTPLGVLIGTYLQEQAQAIEDALLQDGGASQGVIQPGERRGVRDENGQALSSDPGLTFMTDDQVRGIGVKTETVKEDFFDLEGVIQNVMTMSREEMTALMVTAGLLPEQIEKVTAAWEEFHRETDTTAALDEQLAPVALRMQAIYDGLADGSISAGDARVGLASVRAELEGIGGPAAAGLIQGVDATVAGFDELGGASAQVTAALLKLQGVSEQPYDALIRNLEQMKTKPGAAVKEIDALILKLEGLNKKSAALEKFNRYADYIAQVGTAFQQVGAAVGGDLGANILGVGVALQRGADIAKDIASGNWFGAAMKAISALADAWGGYRRAQEEAAKAQKDFLGSFSLIDASTFSSFTTRSRGFFADLFGGGPEVVKQINESAASIAKTIESGVIGGFQNGIKAFLNGTGNLLDGIREGVRGAIIDAITQAVIQGAVIKGALGGLLTELTNTLAGGGDASGIIGQIGAALPGIAQGLEQTLRPLKDTIDRALPKTQSPSSSSSSQTSSSGTSTLQAGTPQVVIDVLGSARDLLRGANEASRLMAEAARKFDGGVDRFERAVDRFSGPHASSTAGNR